MHQHPEIWHRGWHWDTLNCELTLLPRHSEAVWISHCIDWLVCYMTDWIGYTARITRLLNTRFCHHGRKCALKMWTRKVHGVLYAPHVLPHLWLQPEQTSLKTGCQQLTFLPGNKSKDIRKNVEPTFSLCCRIFYFLSFLFYSKSFFEHKKRFNCLYRSCILFLHTFLYFKPLNRLGCLWLCIWTFVPVLSQRKDWNLPRCPEASMAPLLAFNMPLLQKGVK